MWLRTVVALVWLFAAAASSASSPEDAFAPARAAMVVQIERVARLAGPVAGRAAIAPAVLDVMGRVPRHLFVPPNLHNVAYADRPLPISYGQAVSQPYIVALMTDLIDVGPGKAVLEIGTGSGYQAAVLAEMGADVATIEIIPALADQAATRLRTLGYERVAARRGDGYYGWPERAPFDAIIVTAAAGHVPPPLIRQLAPGGRMIIPVGTGFAVQHLVLVEKAGDGTVTTRQLLPVRFVPLTGGP